MMKRSMVFMLIALFMMGIVQTGNSAGTGPVEPLGHMKGTVAVEYNGILERDLDKSGAIAKGEIEESIQTYAKGSLGVGEYFNVYGKLGTANLEQTVTWDSTLNNQKHTLEYDYGFLWGVGGNGLYNFENNVGLGGDIQFNAWYNDVDKVTGTPTPSFTQAGSVDNYEFQASAYLTYKFRTGGGVTFVPYAGGFYSHFTSNVDKAIQYADINNIYSLGDMDGKDEFGVLTGVNILTFENFTLNVEGRFIAETAVTAGLGYKF